MAASLVFTAEARQDLSDAHDWYEADRTGRGGRFLAAVGATTTTICRIPKVGRPVGPRHRKAVVRRFPYVVVYRYDDAIDTVIVVAVFHTSRDPSDLLGRLT